MGCFQFPNKPRCTRIARSKMAVQTEAAAKSMIIRPSLMGYFQFREFSAAGVALNWACWFSSIRWAEP